MRVTLFLIALLSLTGLNAQIDSSVVLNPDTSVALKFSRHPYPGTADVCRNDTVWLYDWQYDSLQNYYRNKYHGMSIWGIGPTADTLIHFGKED